MYVYFGTTGLLSLVQESSSSEYVEVFATCVLDMDFEIDPAQDNMD